MRDSARIILQAIDSMPSGSLQAKVPKVIKVPNTDVFKIAAPILISRGISRIVSAEQLIAL